MTMNKFSHYDYLDAILEAFWKLVFDKTPEEMWCDAIVACHGDKCYGYRGTWEKFEIPFNHGALLYLLTYTSKLGDTPKHKSCEWVIQNYPKYMHKIQEAEKSLSKELLDPNNYS